MPMELTNAPTMFIHTMNYLFFNILDTVLVVFPDDILVNSHMVKEYFMLLEKVLAYISICFTAGF